MNRIFSGITRFLKINYARRALYLLLLGCFALFQYTHVGFARRTFVFYTIDEGKEVVEDRMIPRANFRSGAPGGPSRADGEGFLRELDIKRYVDEALLGPILPESGVLLPRDTRLRSLLYRDGVVYADLSASAALPSPDGRGCFENLYTLYKGIQRNFSYVKDVRLFIEGNQVYPGKFQELGRSKNTGKKTAPAV